MKCKICDQDLTELLVSNVCDNPSCYGSKFFRGFDFEAEWGSKADTDITYWGNAITLPSNSNDGVVVYKP